MSDDGKHAALGHLLLGIAIALAVAAVLALFSFTVLGQGALVPIVGGVAAFLVVQFAIFRLLGLRSRADADSSAPGPDPQEDDDADWRAWRG